MLFDRGGPRISLTAAGEAFFQLVSPLVEGVGDLLLNFAEQLQDTASGDICIGASHGDTAYVLPPVLKRFRDLYPGIRLHLKRCYMREGFRLLLADEVDFLIGPQESVLSETVGDKIAHRSLFSYDLVLVTPLEHPLAGRESISREEAAAWPTIGPTPGTFSTQAGKSAMQAFDLESNVVIRAGGWSAVKHYVEAGLGIALIPSVCITPKDLLSVIPMPQHFERRQYVVFFRTDKRLSAVADRFVELMEDHFSDSTALPSAAI